MSSEQQPGFDEFWQRPGTPTSDEGRPDDDVLDSIREAALYEFPLSARAYRELCEVGQVKGFPVRYIQEHFGSWTAACHAANVVPARIPRGDYPTKWSDEEVLSVVRRYLAAVGVQSSAKHFDAWRRTAAPDAPSSGTLRYRFGSWSEAKRRALAEVAR